MRPLIGILPQALLQKILQSRWNGALNAHLEIVPAHRSDKRSRKFPSVSPRLGSKVHFKDRHCPAVDVGAFGKKLCCRLLRGAVSRRPSSAWADHRRVRIDLRHSCRPVQKSEHRSRFCQAKVTDLRGPAVSEQKIVGFDILMDQVVFMGVSEPSGELDRYVEKPLLHLFAGTLVESTVLYMAFQASFLHPL